jgi:hypothetical protein
VDKGDIFFSYRMYVCEYGFSLEIWHFLRPIMALFFVVIPTFQVVATTIYLLVLAKQVARRGRETLKRQGVITTVLVAVVYCLSVLPYGVYRIGESFLDRDDESNKIFFTTAQSIFWLNTISNFYIYSLTVRSFRNFLRSKLKPSIQFLDKMGISANSEGKIISNTIASYLPASDRHVLRWMLGIKESHNSPHHGKYRGERIWGMELDDELAVQLKPIT